MFSPNYSSNPQTRLSPGMSTPPSTTWSTAYTDHQSSPGSYSTWGTDPVGSYSTWSTDPSTTDMFNTTELFSNGTEASNPLLPAYIAYTSLSLCSIVLGIGVLGNVLVIIVILTSKSMRSSTNLFLLNLSIADLLVLVICCPNGMIEMYMRRDIWLMGKAMCHLVPFIELVVSHTSVLTILAITVERYYAICLPLQAGMIWTKSKAGLVCLVSWILSILLTSPVLAMATYNTSTPPTCTTDVDAPWTKVYFMTIISLFFWFPLVILLILYTTIARKLTAKGPPNKHMGSSSAEKDMKAAERAALTRGRKQIVLMLGTVVTFFFACLLPFKVLTMWIVVSPVEVFDVIDSEVYFNLLYFSRLMFYINSAINPILYNTMSSRFRERFRRVFGCGRVAGKARLWAYGGTQQSGSTTALTSSSRQSRNEKLLSNSSNKIRRDLGKELSPKLQNNHLGPGRIQHGGLDIQRKTKNGTDGSRTADLLEKRLEYLDTECSLKVQVERLSEISCSNSSSCCCENSSCDHTTCSSGRPADSKLIKGKETATVHRNNAADTSTADIEAGDWRSADVRSTPKLGDIKISSLDLDALRDLDRDSWKPRQKVRSRSDGSQTNHQQDSSDPQCLVFKDSIQSIKQTRRKSSMLKVASILSFMHYIENTEETFL
ncbi:neuromedin-U receptor 1 [Eurytemora carolleeae]|uniref:neuromedin-U receptor 1 n=1 Tax=Eurytemora carolleeae TaxID=1294199 RepID=UPI000C774EA4|nr:neuromedin-U receptor 1 [Eurytemora carolleeae]|eukprot:XP_023341475.1 neuromedin-U receptor 1-like [Eurytemora affinis]